MQRRPWMATFRRAQRAAPVRSDTADSVHNTTPLHHPWHRRLGAFLARPRPGVLSRTLAAILGGYALAAASAAFLAVALPMARSQAVLTGMLLAIVVYACAALWAFASGSALRAWAGIATPALLFWLGVQWLGAPA